MSALRFCMLTTFYPPYHFGGDAIAIQRLSRALVRAGHEVTVIHDVDAYHALHRGEPAPVDDADDGVEVIALRSELGVLSPLLTQQTGRPVVHGRRIRRLLAERRFDVVNFHNASLVGGPGILGYGGDAVRLYMAHDHWLVCPTHVLWRHGKEPCPGRECLRCTLGHGRPPQLWRYTGYLERQLARVDAFIAMSEFSRDKHAEFGFPREMEVVPCFLPDAEPARATTSPHDRPYFFFAGRLERIKGLDDVIPAFRDHPEADLVIAGDGEHASALRALAAGNPRVRFLGRLSVESLRVWYEHAIALLVPSVCYETFGVTVIEAFRHGTPVIARRIGPLPDLVHGSEGGLLFATREELLAALRRMQSEPGLRARMSAAGARAFRERWTEQVVLPVYLDVVRRAALRRGGKRVAEALAQEQVA